MTQTQDINFLLKEQFGESIGLEEVSKNVLRVYAPFFYEDGDMLSIYIDTNSENILIRDYGNTLMRTAYTFNFESDNMRRIIDEIVKSYNGMLIDDELSMIADKSNLAMTVNHFSQLIAKTSNIDILQRETVKSLFYDYLNDYIDSNLTEYEINKNCTPSSDKSLVVDFIIKAQRPIYMFGVGSDSKASKTIISCLSFHKEKIPFRSLVVHENIDSLTSFNRKQIINVADKQFDSFDGFKNDVIEYLEREIA